MDDLNPIILATMLHDHVTADLFANCQRWEKRRTSYRPAGEIFDPSRCEVTVVGFAEAKAFTEMHHYSRSFPASRLQVGVWHKPSRFTAAHLAGVAVFSVPMQERVIPAWFDGLSPREGVELGRFVLLPELAANAESWTLARAFRLVRSHLPEVRAILSYCDPVERTDEAGNCLKPGHTGVIYRAHGGAYMGRSSARTLTLAPDGRCVSDRTLSKLRNEERGAGYALRQLVDMGAPARLPYEDARDYVTRAMREGGFKRIRHPGNYAFGWWLGDKRQSPIATGDHSRAPLHTVSDRMLQAA